MDESNPPYRKDSLDDVGILQENIDEISQEKDQEAITIVESKEEEFNEPHALKKGA